MATVGKADSATAGELASQNSIWLIAGFFCLGGSIGFIGGLSDAAVTLPLIAALLALFGGGFIPLLTRIAGAERSVLGKLLCAFAVAFSIFISVGILIKVNRIFFFHTLTQVNPEANKKEGKPDATSDQDYNRIILKSDRAEFTQKIEALCRSGEYNALHQALQEIK